MISATAPNKSALTVGNKLAPTTAEQPVSVLSDVAVFVAACAPPTVTVTSSPYTLYDEQTASFGEDEDYNQADSAGFINLFGLPIKVKAKMHGNK